jgi:arginine metabolism regulation protein II
MYTWFRILAESTYVLHEWKAIPEDELGDVERVTASNGISSQACEQRAPHPPDKLDDFLRFRSYQAVEDDAYDGMKETEVALYDIHLEDSRDNPNTMYTTIFGISETWLSLLSKTTRLANRLDASRTVSEPNQSSNNPLQRKASRLEDMICSFASSFSSTSEGRKDTVNVFLHRAFNAALVILFYRRIRNVNQLILQSHVDDVIEALESYSQQIDLTDQQGWSSVWPAFIAGSEANTVYRRDHLLRWIERGEARTALNCYSATKDLLLELWSRRDEVNSRSRRSSRSTPQSVTWVDLCREKKLWLMACR